MSCKVSIIIPVYNAERYLKECLDSVIYQKYQYIELILINDGSSDSSEMICQEYVKKDKRVKLINQKNGGVSSARNVGIGVSTGTIILFLDSDDLLEYDAIQTIVNNIDNNDMLCYGYKEIYKNNYNNILLKENNLTNKDLFLKRVYLTKEIGGYLWNKIFRADIIKNNKILFDTNLHFCEDLVFVVEYLKYCKSVHYLNKTLYIYRMRKSSVSYNFFNKKNITLLNSYKKLINCTDDIDVINRLKYNYLVSYYKLKKFVPKDFFVDKDIIKNEKIILKNENLSKKELLTFYLIKHFNLLYRFLRNEKNKKLNLFD